MKLLVLIALLTCAAAPTYAQQNVQQDSGCYYFARIEHFRISPDTTLIKDSYFTELLHSQQCIEELKVTKAVYRKFFRQTRDTNFRPEHVKVYGPYYLKEEAEEQYMEQLLIVPEGATRHLMTLSIP